MSIAAPVNTWDDPSGARRPSLNDMGGASLEDDAKNPPNPNLHPTSAQLNQYATQCRSIGSTAPSAIIDVTNNGSAAVIARMTACGTNVLSGTFTVTRVSVGLVSITWTPGALPVSVANPTIQMTTDAPWLDAIPIPISNGFQVKSRDNTNTLADGNFTIVIY